MNSVLDLLNKIVKPGQIAAITINGLISAFAVALLLWPPTAVDVIHVVGKNEDYKVRYVDNKPTIDAIKFEARDAGCDQSPAFNLNGASDPGEIDRIEVENQLILETAQANLQKCSDLFNFKIVDLTNRNKQIADEIGVLKTAQASAQTDLLAYQKAGSSMQIKFQERYDNFTREITDHQGTILKNERTIGSNNLQINKLTEYLAVIKLRLSDPSRIRSSQGFDDALQGIANHIAGFLALAVVVGTAYQPFQRVFLSFFDLYLKNNP